MTKKQVATDILHNLTTDEIQALALEAIERRMKAHDQPGAANALLNKLMPPKEKDFSRFFQSFKEGYQSRKEQRTAPSNNHNPSDIFYKQDDSGMV